MTKVCVYRYRTSHPLLKVQRALQAVNRLGNLGLEVKREDEVLAFYVD